MKTAHLDIYIDCPLEEFTPERRQGFIDSLCVQAGVLPTNIYNVRFERGCTIFSADMDAEAVKYLLDAFINSSGGPERDDLTGFSNFVKHNKITLITGSIPRPKKVSFEAEILAESPIVVFVHGWNGGDDSFGNFPEFISSITGLRCEKYVYPTGIWSHSPELFLISRNLENWIRNRFEGAPLCFIAHSMGGLVVRKMVATQCFRSNPLDRYVRHVTFVASPHGRVNWATLAEKIPFLRKAQIHSLTPNSVQLLELNEAWFRWAGENIPEKCHSRSIYGSDDDVVPVTSAASFDNDAVPILGRGHIDIVKPTDANDEVVATIVRLFKQAGLCKV